MSLYELLNLANSLSTRIDTHWALFITVHLALIGGIIYVDRPLSIKEKSGACVIYTGFALINYLMMKNQAAYLGTVYQQINSIKENDCCSNNYIVDYVVNLYQHGSSTALLTTIVIVHLIMFIVVILSIMFDKADINPSSTDNNKIDD